MSSVRLRELRAALPGWVWTAERYGMGWRYVGTRHGRRVTVYATASFCGPLEDDCTTVWRADDGVESTDYATWRMKNTRDEP